MTIFTAYLDASRGEGGDADVYSVAGFIADADRWETFGAKWKEALDGYGLSSFHMTDFEGGFGEFKGWERDDPRRKPLLNALFDVIQDHTIGSIAYGVSQAMYDAVVSQAATRLSGGPYFFLFLNLTLGAEDVMSRISAVPSDWQMVYMLERGDRGLGQMVTPWMGAGSEQARLDTHMAGVFISPTNKNIYPFEAADFMAFESRKQVSAQLGLHPRRPRRSLVAFEEKYTHPTSWHFYQLDHHLRSNAEIIERLVKELITDVERRQS